SFKDLYDKLEEPIKQKIRQHGDGNRQQITEQVAEDWKNKFTTTPEYKKNVYEPLKELGKVQTRNVKKSNRLGLFGAIRQWLTLSRRYAGVLLRDKLNLFILLAQAPIIAVLTYFVMGENQPRDFLYFILSLVSVWFGISVAAREIIRERPIYKRERMINLGLVPYLFSKIFVLGIIVSIQCLLLFLPLKFFDLTDLMPMPGELLGLPQFWTMLLTAAVGIALGLLISAVVKTSELATSLVPLILIPQILFSGLVGVPSGINNAAGLLMPTTWSFDTMKRYSTLDTLEEKGAKPNGKTNGKGLYKYVETENDKIIADAKSELDDYKNGSEKKLDDFKVDLNSGGNPDVPKLGEPPTISDAVKVPENLSNYVNFLHPWMNEILNQFVLMLMFWILVVAALFVLRLQDIG
ncbi:MAG: ABC transporter permease, partial [Acidobacteriota bacterium]